MKRKIMKPIKMWIDGKCYTIRKLDKRSLPGTKSTVKPKVKTDSLFSTKFQLPSLYYIKLEQIRNPQINTVEATTNTTINYPKHGKDGFLEILGDSKESIEEAREQIHSFIGNIREQVSALQFIAIPLLSEEIKHNFEIFKEKILSEKHQGVEDSIFQSVLKLHLTVVVFTLLNEEEKQHAKEALEECKNCILENNAVSGPLKIRIEGLNCMNENLSKVNILYSEAKLTDESSEKSLQKIVNSISEKFYDSGLVRGYQENVKLHMTIMNTKYRNKQEGTFKRRWVKRETFDATKIIEQYKNYYFGEAVFDTIHLSFMSSKDEDGFYKSLCTIKF